MFIITPPSEELELIHPVKSLPLSKKLVLLRYLIHLWSNSLKRVVFLHGGIRYFAVFWASQSEIQIHWNMPISRVLQASNATAVAKMRRLLRIRMRGGQIACGKVRRLDETLNMYVYYVNKYLFLELNHQ